MDRRHQDDRGRGRLLDRRQALALLGTSAGGALLVAYAPRMRASSGRLRFAPTADAATLPSCIVRPEETEGPYFVDEKLERSDIRSDPSTGAVKDGARLALAFFVSRIDGSSCVPFEGVLVDVWHCDALGVYSDVSDPSFDTVGQKFLRGYQMTDANGAASFVTIYPGWYQGRTVHIHFKIRTDPDADQALEFTSQLYFDDELTDIVQAQQPYAAKGQRTLRNDGDGIYQNGGSQLLLTVADDGSGGYTTTFEIGIQARGTTTTTVRGGATTTTVTPATCATITACLADLDAALPDPATARDRKWKRTARRLRRRFSRTSAILARAGATSGSRQARQYARAEVGLAAILVASRAADAKSTLGVALAPIEASIAALLEQIPSRG
jgi:protocatechuate 3,4-dioxygenase beta subunit